MSELLVTQCPYCQTRFRLTPEQLGVAAGKVRCGACLEIFQALEVRMPAPAPATDPGAVEPESAENNMPRGPDTLDEPDLEALGLDDSIIAELNPASRHEPGLSEPEQAADLTAATTTAANDSLGDLHADFLATTPARDFGPEHVTRQVDLHIDSPTAEAADGHGIALASQPGNPVPLHPEAASTSADAADDYQGNVDLDPASDPRREPVISALAAVDLLGDELFQEPLARRPRRRWLWGTLCLLALLALPAQFLFYNFDALARDQRTRPLLESLCLLAACEVPARVDISRLRSANLLVRTDAEFPNALAIDVILYNRADFAQPFPILQMQFTDAGGRTVASRRFRPEEYLSGELAGIQLMPPQTPIHVALSMLNPGPQASGYSLEFVSP